MQKVIITTVGTSLFVKCSGDKDKQIDGKLKDMSYNEDLFEVGSQVGNADKIQERIADFVKYLSCQGNAACAETTSLAKLPTDAKVVLLCTETTLSRMCGEALKQHLCCKVLDLQVISGLRIDNANEFQTIGLPNLMDAISKLECAEVNEKKSYECELNISGGYKALIPVLTIMGQLYKLPLHYIYEEKAELITIDASPIDFNWDIIADNYNVFELVAKEDHNKPLWDDMLGMVTLEQDVKSLVNFFEYQGQKKAKFSILGAMAWKSYNEKSQVKKQSAALIEYKLYEYYSENHASGSVKQGHKPHGYDIDVYIETDKEVVYCEVKPGGNVPITGKDSIEKKLKEGGFYHMLQDSEIKKEKIFRLIAYAHNDLHKQVIQKVKILFEEQPKVEKTAYELWHLKVPDNYRKNVEWKVGITLVKIL